MQKLLLLILFSSSMRAACIAAVGSQRANLGAEIARWAAQNGIAAVPPEPVCSEGQRVQINPAEVVAGIKALFGVNGQRIQVEVVELCQCAVPRGSIMFSLVGLVAPPFEHPDKAIVWRGELTSRTGATYPVWVRARVLEVQTMVRIKSNKQAKQVLERSEVEEVEAAMSPLLVLEPQKAERYIGKVLTLPVQRGSLLLPGYVKVLPVISAGETIKVDVVNGSTKLTIEARAQSSGDPGEKIALQNPINLNRFEAVVTGRGKAQILLAPFRDESQKTSEKNTNDDGTVSKKSL